ncbi:MAG: type IV pilus modification PilV family protein [Clostridium sp.]|uniref:type IV pilus modification PilV family protein n=1 Tax=Clostridium sp. TaxID=1506 RepID=UPI003F2CCCBA
MTLIKENGVKRIFSNKKGVSLVEIVAALAIFSILFIGVTQLIATANKSEINTNVSMENISASGGIRDILFGESNQFFEKYLMGKTIILEGTDLDSIQKMLLSNIESGKAKAQMNNTYTSENSKESPIKYKIYITTKENDDGLYSVVLTCVTLKNTQYYYYEGGEAKGDGASINISPTNKDFQSLSEEMVIRPIN